MDGREFCQVKDGLDQRGRHVPADWIRFPYPWDSQRIGAVAVPFDREVHQALVVNRIGGERGETARQLPHPSSLLDSFKDQLSTFRFVHRKNDRETRLVGTPDHIPRANVLNVDVP